MRRRMKINLLCVLSYAMMFSAIAFGQSVTSTYDEEFSFSRLRTFGFKAEKRELPDRLATDTITEKKIRQALADELGKVGYHQFPEGTSPDFLVSFHVETRDKTHERGRDKSYVQGSLIVDFVDAETKELIWRGIASSLVGDNAVDLKLTENKVKIAAKLLMERFTTDRSRI